MMTMFANDLESDFDEISICSCTSVIVEFYLFDGNPGKKHFTKAWNKKCPDSFIDFETGCARRIVAIDEFPEVSEWKVPKRAI